MNKNIIPRKAFVECFTPAVDRLSWFCSLQMHLRWFCECKCDDFANALAIPSTCISNDLIWFEASCDLVCTVYWVIRVARLHPSYYSGSKLQEGTISMIDRSIKSNCFFWTKLLHSRYFALWTIDMREGNEPIGLKAILSFNETVQSLKRNVNSDITCNINKAIGPRPCV